MVDLRQHGQAAGLSARESVRRRAERPTGD